MSLVTSLLSISVGAILVENFIFSQFLGICPFMGVSKKIDRALGMGVAVTFVMAIASAVTWVVNAYFLDPATSVLGVNLQFMQTVALHPRHRRPGASWWRCSCRRSVPALYHGAGHLSAADHHELRCAGRGAAEYPARRITSLNLWSMA